MVVVGLDEAGAGPGFGSLWAGAVYLKSEITGVDDSKRLSERKRNLLRPKIEEGSHYGLGEVTSTEIDELGMAEARRLVFERALDNYVERNGPEPTFLEIDGTIFRPWKRNGVVVPYRLTPGGDALYPCVSAASILAKTTRDAQIIQLCKEHPELNERYDLCANKGYLSKRHMDGIQTYGMTDGHRRSFKIARRV